MGGSVRWTTALGAVSMLATLLIDSPRAVSLQAGGRPADLLSAGKLLVSARGLDDPNFLQSVVLLVAYNKEGAAGVILNRQTEATLESLLPGLAASPTKPGLVFLGGPVERSHARVLLRSPTARRDAARVLPDVYFFESRDLLNKLLSDGAGPDRLRVYVGYAGWGAGQLEREVGLGAWHVFEGTSDVVFDSRPETMWPRLIRRTELRSA